MRRLLGASAVAALTLSVAGTGNAWASGTPGGDGWDKSDGGYESGQGAGTATAPDKCEFSLDGTKFASWVKLDDQNLKPTDDGKVHIKVRTAGKAETCTASLASYRTYGPDFKTSGEQVFHDFDTVAVKRGSTDSLDISVPDAGCYAQIDLYRGSVKFDGKLGEKDGFEHGELPKGPDRPVIKDKLIMAWNGGVKDCTKLPEKPPTTPPPATPPATPPTKTPPAETPPVATPPASTPPATPPSTPTPSESTTAPAPVPTPNGDLAETGGGSVVPIAAGAAALLAVGGGVFFFTRRRSVTGA